MQVSFLKQKLHSPLYLLSVKSYKPIDYDIGWYRVCNEEDEEDEVVDMYIGFFSSESNAILVRDKLKAYLLKYFPATESVEPDFFITKIDDKSQLSNDDVFMMRTDYFYHIGYVNIREKNPYHVTQIDDYIKTEPRRIYRGICPKCSDKYILWDVDYSQCRSCYQKTECQKSRSDEKTPFCDVNSEQSDAETEDTETEDESTKPDRCELCLNEFHGPYEDHYAWGYTQTSLTAYDNDKPLTFIVCRGCMKESLNHLRMDKPCDRLIVTLDENGDIYFYEPNDIIPEHPCRYGVVEDCYGENKYRFFDFKFDGWCTKDTVQDKELFYCRLDFLWEDTGKISHITDGGRLRYLKEVSSYIKLMEKTPPERKFVFGDEKNIEKLQKLFFAKDEISPVWFDTVEKVKEYMRSGKFYYTDKHKLLLTDEFVKFYKNSRNNLRKMLETDKF